MRSFIRLRQRRKVDLPHPDGPMKAVTCRSGMSRSMPFRACLSPYQALRPRMVNALALAAGATGAVSAVAASMPRGGVTWFLGVAAGDCIVMGWGFMAGHQR